MVSILPEYAFGIVLDWADFDKRNPPVFESQAGWLKRFGLLTPGEEQRADFEPETVNDFFKLAEGVGAVAG